MSPTSATVSGSATAELWRRLGRPFDPVGALEAMTGLPPFACRQLVGLGLAVSDEADHLLEGIHDTIRSLAIATASVPVRAVGEIRGPVLWGETLAARAGSPGAGQVFICSAPLRAYDTEENRVLCHALSLVRAASTLVEHSVVGHDPDPSVQHARANGDRAAKALEHRSLLSVPRGRPSNRALRKARSGSRANVYRPALNVLQRAAEPVEAATVVNSCDEHTRRQHALLLALHERFREFFVDPGPYRVEGATLRSGPLRYMHPRRADSDGIYGVLCGDLLVDVAPETADTASAEQALAARAFGHRVLLVTRAEDLDEAVQQSERRARNRR